MATPVALSLLAVLVPALGRAVPACPGVRAPDTPNVVVKRDLLVPMSDGVVLHANVVLPSLDGKKPKPGSFPVLLTQTPYNKNSVGLNFEDDSLVEHGYAQVIVDVRGTGSSAGNWDSFGAREQQD